MKEGLAVCVMLRLHGASVDNGECPHLVYIRICVEPLQQAAQKPHAQVLVPVRLVHLEGFKVEESLLVGPGGFRLTEAVDVVGS